LTQPERYRKAQRLRGEAIAQILSVSRSRRAGPISVRIKPNGLNFSRLGLIVPKRYLPRAVDRNRARRVIREWFRRKQAQLCGQDVLVRLSGSPPHLESLTADLERLFAVQ
jgi:ribonuclease P protein component